MNHLRKIIAISLAAATLTAYAATAVYADDYKKGDLNMDGAVDSSDALLILQASCDSDEFSSLEYYLADFNDNDIIDSEDALLTLRKSASLDETDSEDYVEENDEDYNDYINYEDYTDYEDYYQEEDTYITSGTQVADMEGWSAADVIEKVGPLFTEDQRKTGILASVSLAQFILESGYGQSKLSIEANNCFGIKGYKESTPRVDSPWDGVSVYTISTKEYDSYGNSYYIDADFRKYDCMEDSIEDHSNVLINASYDGGITHLYEGIVGCTDYKKAAQIIYNGGYATSPDYVSYLCRLIEQWDLTQYDLANAPESYTSSSETLASSQGLYRVRISWDDASSQLGAYSFLENAIECADLNPGYSVYDSNGNIVYTA